MLAKRVASFNGKGGCGKTTSIFHTAGVLASRGEKVLIIDLDKQRNCTDTLLMEIQHDVKYTFLDFMRGYVDLDTVVQHSMIRSRGNAKPKYYGIDVLPADVQLEDESLYRGAVIKDKLDDFIERMEYDWVLVDMPPSNKTLNEICFSQIVDFVIAPFTSDIYSVSGFGDLMNTINRAREYNENLEIIGIFLSRYMANCAVDRYIRDELMEFKGVFIDIQIPLRADIREAVMFGRPISYYKMFSPSKVAYERLVDFMDSRIRQKM